MVLSPKRKAALVLMSLDPAAAAELLKAAKPETLTEIAAEIVNLESGGDTVRQEAADPRRDEGHGERGGAGGHQPAGNDVQTVPFGPRHARHRLQGFHPHCRLNSHNVSIQ